MRRLVRPALALSLGLATVLGGAAVAAPKPVCKLATDAKGDTFAARAQDGQATYGPQEDKVDITSADLASNGKVLTGVVRVANLGATMATSPYGAAYDINFVAPRITQPLFMRATISNAGTAVSQVGHREALPAVTSLSTVLATGKAVVDTKKNEVRFTFPLSVFSSLGGVKAGDKLAFGEITTGRAAGDSRAVFADVTTDAKSYTVGARSCVTPGK